MTLSTFPLLFEKGLEDDALLKEWMMTYSFFFSAIGETVEK